MPTDPRLRTRVRSGRHPAERQRASAFMLHLALAAVTMLFVGLTFAYTFGRKLSGTWDTFSLPKGFWLSTLLLLGTSYAFRRAREAFDADDARALRRALLGALAGGLGFLASQVFAWRALSASGVGLGDSPAGGYLYVISWLHAAHVLVGLAALGLFLRGTLRGTRDAVQGLLYFSDGEVRHRLGLLGTYWHVVDGLWVYLFLFFLFFHS